jgi:hypothetical protein
MLKDDWDVVGPEGAYVGPLSCAKLCWLLQDDCAEYAEKGEADGMLRSVQSCIVGNVSLSSSAKTPWSCSGRDAHRSRCAGAVEEIPVWNVGMGRGIEAGTFTLGEA